MQPELECDGLGLTDYDVECSRYAFLMRRVAHILGVDTLGCADEVNCKRTLWRKMQ
jgi:hypothetical protein